MTRHFEAFAAFVGSDRRLNLPVTINAAKGYTVIFTVLVPEIFCDSNILTNNSLHTRLALDVFKTKPNQNIVVSSLAIRFPLCKLASVAKGVVKNELLTILGINKANMATTCYKHLSGVLTEFSQADLTWLNKIFVNYTDGIDNNFIANSSQLHGVQVDKVGFNYPKSAASFINRWVETASFKRITDILEPGDVGPNTTMLVISGAYLKATWEFQFDISLTQQNKFHHLNNKVSYVPMMTNLESYLFLDYADMYKIVTLKLITPYTIMTFVVPYSSQNLPGFLEKLRHDPELLKNARSEMKWTFIRVRLPRFKIKTYVDLTGFLKQVGLNQTLNSSSSDLNNILKPSHKSPNMYLSKVMQKVFLEIDEYGIVRHPRAEGVPVGRSEHAAMDNIDFTADRPFYFTVNIEIENVPHELFNGVYYGPE